MALLSKPFHISVPNECADVAHSFSKNCFKAATGSFIGSFRKSAQVYGLFYLVIFYILYIIFFQTW